MKTRKMISKWIALGLISMALVLVIGLSLAQASSMNQEPTISPNERLIQELEISRDSVINPKDQILLDEKIEILKQEEQRRIVALDQAKSLQSEGDFCDLLGDAEPSSELIQSVGIFEGERDLIPGTQFVIRNFWIGYVNDQVVEVAIASSLVDQSQVIVVRYKNSDRGGAYPAPDGTGPLLIVAEDNQRLTLESVDGQQFFFDVPGETFVASLAESVPAIEPAPTYTPTPDPCAP